ncbi:MAG: DUF5691 domain-containing protein [Pirellulales bacterium]
MNSAATLDNLVSAALLGTRGSADRLPALPDELATVLSPAGRDAETRLLDAAAAATLCSRAGAQAREGIARCAASPPDRWPECSPRAAAILAQAFAENLHPVLVEWLELAAAARQRPPHHLLPQLLEAAAARRALRPLASQVVDERGDWLMQFNPRWQFASPTAEQPEQVWQLGNRQQRAEVLRTLRASDPAAARDLIATTWKDDGADERAEWAATLQIALSDADEAFLESCLDDRSSRVREIAADLLARLPGSQLTTRMIERAAPLVAFHPGEIGKLLNLKRAVQPSLEVTLPAAYDKSWQRDGISERPGEKLGQKQWWLLQIVGGVPLDHWTNTFGASASTIVAAAPSDFATVLVRGWLIALARRPVVEWIEPLLAASETKSIWNAELLRAVPAARRAVLLTALLARQEQPYGQLQQIVAAWRPFDVALSQAMLKACDPALLLLTESYFSMHPQALAELDARLADWRGAPSERRRADQALNVSALRRDIHREFAA